MIWTSKFRLFARFALSANHLNNIIITPNSGSIFVAIRPFLGRITQVRYVFIPTDHAGSNCHLLIARNWAIRSHFGRVLYNLLMADGGTFRRSLNCRRSAFVPFFRSVLFAAGKYIQWALFWYLEHFWGSLFDFAVAISRFGNRRVLAPTSSCRLSSWN